jgi:hypothetical protein
MPTSHGHEVKPPKLLTLTRAMVADLIIIPGHANNHLAGCYARFTEYCQLSMLMSCCVNMVESVTLESNQLPRPSFHDPLSFPRTYQETTPDFDRE